MQRRYATICEYGRTDNPTQSEEWGKCTFSAMERRDQFYTSLIEALTSSSLFLMMTVVVSAPVPRPAHAQDASPSLVQAAKGTAAKLWEPVPGTQTPEFTITDIDGKPRSLKSFQRQSVALYFFCGCQPCRQTAAEWATLQRSGMLPTGQNGSSDEIVTLVVFQGEAESAREFAAEAKMDPNRTFFLPDPLMEVTKKFSVEMCPRIFVLNQHGTLTYTNNHTDDAAQKAPPSAIVAKTTVALKDIVTKPLAPPPFPDFPNASPVNRLTVLAKDGVEAMSPFAGRRWYPKVDPYQTQVVEQTFVLRNNNAVPLTLDRFHIPCGCTSTVLTKDGVEVKQPTLQPGDEVLVKVAVKAKILKPGITNEYVVAYARGMEKYVAVMAMSVNADELVKFIPEKLDLGKVPNTEERTIEVMAIVDERLLKGPKPMHLVTTSDDITFAPKGTATPVRHQGRPAIQQTYTVTLKKNALIGWMHNLLMFMDKDARKPTDRDWDPRERMGWAFVLNGQITGQLEALPPICPFGEVLPGKTVTRRVLLRNPGNAGTDGLTVSSSLPGVEVRLVPPTDEDVAQAKRFLEANKLPVPDDLKAQSIIVEATTTEKIAPGSLDSRIIVTNKRGERLGITISGHVFAPDEKIAAK